MLTDWTIVFLPADSKVGALGRRGEIVSRISNTDCIFICGYDLERKITNCFTNFKQELHLVI